MVIDTSAVVAILSNEPDAETLERAVAADPVRLMSAATLLETSIIIESKFGEAGGRELDLWIDIAEVEIVPVTNDHASAARTAYRRFGKGRHPAGLNFGDCYAYALVAISGEPLLCKGDGFARTDLVTV